MEEGISEQLVLGERGAPKEPLEDRDRDSERTLQNENKRVVSINVQKKERI